MKTQKIIPHLWFDPDKNPAEEAVAFYTFVFNDSKTGTISHYGESGKEIHRQKPGSLMTLDFTIEAQNFIALNGGPHFQFNPSISFFVICESKEETREIWKKLDVNSQVLMPLDTYQWSSLYGWIQDKYGLHWQVILEEPRSTTQKIVPSFFFTGKSHGKAEEAVQFYSSVFKNSDIEGILKYTEEDKNDYALGKVKHAQFQLEGQTFMAMDSGMENDFPFNEAISLVIDCETQEEIDYYWNKLSAVPESEQCGWLKDKFGISWQVIPSALITKMMQDPSTEKRERAIASFMQMKKVDINKLQADFYG